MSLILRFVKERSYLAHSITMQKLASKVVKAGAYCGGTRGGSMAQDDLPHFKYLNLILLGSKRSLEDIGEQKLMSHSKFVKIMQAKLL